jgi:hypothetical protein
VFPALEDAMRVFAPKTAVGTGELADVRVKDLIAARTEETLRRSPTTTDLRPDIALRGVVPDYLRTEVPYVFAVSFTAFFTINQGIEDALHGEAAVTGQCRLDTRQPSIKAVSIQLVHWTLTGPDGKTTRMREAPDGVGQPGRGPGGSRWDVNASLG